MMKRRNPLKGNIKDKLLLTCLRRENLDAKWTREPSTVDANRREINRAIEISDLVGMDPGFNPLGPYPDEDIQVITVAVQMLIRSLDPGKYADYSQFETIRKLRSSYSNAYLATADACESSSTLGRTTVKSFLTNCPTNSLWLGMCKTNGANSTSRSGYFYRCRISFTRTNQTRH